MKKHTLILLLLTIATLHTHADEWDYASTEQLADITAQLRLGAEFNKKWNHGIELGINEDLRFDLYSTLNGPAFNKSYTTLHFAYAPIKPLKIDIGYTLKIMGIKGVDNHWDDYNEWLRHRLFASITASYTINHLKLYIRERAMCEIRTDSVNPLEKNKYNWLLRSKIGAEYKLPDHPIKPYVWLELVNTLNVPEYQKHYKNNDPTQYKGHQYISRIRTAVGVKWKINHHNTLDFYYRFNYEYDRDINIKKSTAAIELIEEYTYQHAIGITYNFHLGKK